MNLSTDESNSTPSPYQLKVMSELLTQAYLLDVDLEEFVEFLASQVQRMIVCPPNYNFMGEKKRVWILRGFYDKAPLFFKMTVCTIDGMNGYYAKASPMRVTYSSKRHATRVDNFVRFDGKELNDMLTDRMENIFFQANHEVKNVISEKVKMPRCMSPKGMKLLKYKKKRRKNDKS
jgi:hypothetical protein